MTEQAINMNGKVLLQNGDHFGEIVKADFDQPSGDLQVAIKFSDSGVLLRHTVNLAGPKVSREFQHLAAGPRQVKDASELVGRKCWFNVELLMVKTANGPVGVNAITAALPKR